MSNLPKIATLELVTYPDPRLREVARAVTPDEMKYARDLGDRMKVLCRQHDGIGLAANQVGVLLRVIVVQSRTGFITCINPEITELGTQTESSDEGCLSHPGVLVPVTRSASVRVKYLTGYGAHATAYAHRLTARIFQHEIDHLDGISIVDKAPTP